MAENKPYAAPNGKHVVKLKVRFEQHNVGEVCGFEEEVARQLVSKNYAEHHLPTDEEREAHQLEREELAASKGKLVPKPQLPINPKAPAK
jgi:hypothetical protein